MILLLRDEYNDDVLLLLLVLQTKPGLSVEIRKRYRGY